jgi:DNA-binding beta-propeller fold protein YncE
MKFALALALLTGCVKSGTAAVALVTVADVPLPGGATRFDYQEVDSEHGHLVLAHMGDSELLVLKLEDGSVAARFPGIETIRGVTVGGGRIFATATNGQLVMIDASKLTELGRATTGTAPDGVAFDPSDAVVATSDQRAGALSLFTDSGSGARTAVPLGAETGNVVYDAARKVFWVTAPPELVSVDPRTGAVGKKLALPGCEGAHGLRVFGSSALVACEDNDVLLRVDLESGAAVSAATGKSPDVLAIDPGLKWLYVAAESGDVVIFDLGKDGLVEAGRFRPGDRAHTAAVDPATHRVYFPLESGPTLKIMAPRL